MNQGGWLTLIKTEKMMKIKMLVRRNLKISVLFEVQFLEANRFPQKQLSMKLGKTKMLRTHTRETMPISLKLKGKIYWLLKTSTLLTTMLKNSQKRVKTLLCQNLLSLALKSNFSLRMTRVKVIDTELVSIATNLTWNETMPPTISPNFKEKLKIQTSLTAKGKTS